MRAAILIAISVCLAAALGCGEAKERAHEHKAAHGGVLNAMGTCENGHVEAKLEGTTMTLWFVGGGSDTDKAVRVPNEDVSLTVTVEGLNEPRVLDLEAKPNELAEEKVGDCSRFEGQADWFKGAKAFVATGVVMFKGKQQAVRIEYPKGYDPD